MSGVPSGSDSVIEKGKEEGAFIGNLKHMRPQPIELHINIRDCML